MEGPGAVIAAALEHVGPRLKELRQRRGITLTGLAASTGISKSTLSRLENGQRRPTLELLLPLAHAHRVPLDDLVGAPEVADPRVRLKPRQRNGRTVIPLARHPGGLQAWKIVIPTSKNTPEPKAHEGYEWLYVISGRMRLVLAGHDIVLGPGEVAEFDTHIPHWFGSTGDEPAEVLSVFGPQGERMHTRARPAPNRHHAALTGTRTDSTDPSGLAPHRAQTGYSYRTDQPLLLTSAEEYPNPPSGTERRALARAH